MPAPRLEDLVDPATTAVVTSECQRGVVGAQAVFPGLAEIARATALPNVVRIVDVAREAGVTVVHALAHRRADGAGANTNARLFAAAARAPVRLGPDTAAGALVDELAGHPDDLVSTRLHGLGPMAGTDLDALLRNEGVTAVVVVGVSVNVAVTNLVMDAVNLGYQVVLPRDAVAGVPPAYADEVIDRTLSLLASVTTTDQLVTTWAARSTST